MWAAETNAHDQLVIALVGALTAVIALLGVVLRSKLAVIATDTAEVNAAVNHKDTGELSLYRLADSNTRKLDQVIEKQSEFDRKWGNLPAGIGDAVTLAQTLHDMDLQIHAIHNELVDHIAWESAKYEEGLHP